MAWLHVGDVGASDGEDHVFTFSRVEFWVNVFTFSRVEFWVSVSGERFHVFTLRTAYGFFSGWSSPSEKSFTPYLFEKMFYSIPLGRSCPRHCLNSVYFGATCPCRHWEGQEGPGAGALSVAPAVPPHICKALRVSAPLFRGDLQVGCSSLRILGILVPWLLALYHSATGAIAKAPSTRTAAAPGSPSACVAQRRAARSPSTSAT